MRAATTLTSAALCLVALVPSRAVADQPIELRQSYVGTVDFFASGVPLAIDGPDSDTTMVDTHAQPGTVSVDPGLFPEDSTLRQAFVYWGGSISNADCGGSNVDDAVTFTPPGGAPASLIADACFCSDAGAQSYDMQLCRADVTDRVTQLGGDYTLDGFNALIANGATNTASFSIVLVYEQRDLPVRRIALYDGLLTMWNQATTTQTYTLDGLEIDNPASGDLTWYVLEGDEGGTGTESVSVRGLPSGGSSILADALNPATNPMNHTINTTTPPQPGSIGVDIDRFDISSALAFQDSSVEMTYNAGSDKYWIAYNIVGVNVFEPNFGGASFKAWAMQDDADANGAPSAGDTIRYTIGLDNVGGIQGQVDVVDIIPAEAASWSVVSLAGGVDVSSAETLGVDGITVDPGTRGEVQFDVVIADVPDLTPMSNSAGFDATPEGDAGVLVAPDVIIRRDGDADGTFDSDDNCPAIANPDQVDADMNMVGDVCEGTTATSDTTDTSDTSDTSAASAASGEVGSEAGSEGETGASAGLPTTGLSGDEGNDSGSTGCSCTSGDGQKGGEGFAALGILGLLGLRRRRASAAL